MDSKYTFGVVVETYLDFNHWRIDCGFRSGKKKKTHFFYNEIRYIPILEPDNLRGWKMDGCIVTERAKFNVRYDEIMHYIDVEFLR